MAELFLASCAGIGGAQKIAVVKRILPELSSDPEFTRMFLNEARLASMLEHPNVVQVFDSGRDDDRYYFAMEYIHGPDVREIMRAQARGAGPIPLGHALSIVEGICAGLHHAHERRGADGEPLRIVHRDVSPNNVLVSYEGVVKVVDFGIARASTQTTVTRGGARKGKLSYMSPEQAQGSDLDRRCDVFGIGIMLYELTTMRRLFKGDNELAVLHEILFREVVPPSEVVDGYPPALEAIVMQALARDRDERFESAQALQIALEEAADSLGLARSTRALARYVGELIPAPTHPAEDLAGGGVRKTGTPSTETEGPTLAWTPPRTGPEATATISLHPPADGAPARRRAGPIAAVAAAALTGVGLLWFATSGGSPASTPHTAADPDRPPAAASPATVDASRLESAPPAAPAAGRVEPERGDARAEVSRPAHPANDGEHDAAPAEPEHEERPATSAQLERAKPKTRNRPRRHPQRKPAHTSKKAAPKATVRPDEPLKPF